MWGGGWTSDTVTVEVNAVGGGRLDLAYSYSKAKHCRRGEVGPRIQLQYR